MAHWFKTIWAESGTKTPISEVIDPSGYVSYEQGYGADYQRVLGADPLAKPIERDKLNQVLFDITGALNQYQTSGFPEFITAAVNGGAPYPYAIGATVRFTDNKNYTNTVAGNTNDPSVSGWVLHNNPASAIVASTAKTTPVDADLIGIADSAASNVLKKLSWLNIKATLKAYFDSLYAPVGSGMVSGVRQTVQSGSVDANGYANFLATSANLTMPISATTVNLVIHASGGAISNDRIGKVLTNTSLLLPASLTNFIFATVSSLGVVTFSSVTLAPIYQFGGTPSVTNNQYTFNISEMKMYLGNGSTATQVWAVCIGEAITSGTAVTSVVSYALNGMYASGYTATLPAGSTSVSRNSNLGITPLMVSITIENISTDNGFAVGDIIVINATGSIAGGTFQPTANKNTCGFSTNSSTLTFIPKSGAGGTTVALTLAKWKYKLIANRGW